MTIVISAILLCLAAGLAFSMRKSRNKPDSAYAKAWLQIKTLRIFPARSFVYAFFAFVIVFLGLLTADRVSGHERDYHEYLVNFMMHFEKLDTGRDYPLVAIKGREEISRDRPKILVVGDSFVWGYLLTNLNQVWWRIMSSELDRRGYSCEVVAVAFTGAATEDELNWLRDTSMLADIAPDLIIVGYVPNDHELQMITGIYNPTLIDLYINKFAKTERTDKLFPNVSQHIFSSRARAKTDDDFAITPFKDTREVELYDRNVVRPLGEFIRELGIPLIIYPTPGAPRPGFDTVYRYALPLFEKAGMPVYNPLDDFIKKYPNRNNKYFAVSPIDPHPGPATSWFLGGYAADVLERNYASILGEKRTDEKAYPIEVNDWIPCMLEPRAIRESASLSQYVFEFPDQSSTPDFENHDHGSFLTLPLRQKYVKLNFKYPVDLSSVKIEGDDLLSAEVWTLAINHKLGFDDQKPVKWTGRNNRRDVTSLLISAKTIDGKQAALTIAIEGEVNM